MNKKIYKVLIVFLVILCLGSVKVNANQELTIDAKAGLIIEVNTGKIIYEKDIKKQSFPASLTKILTAILVIENCELDDIATVSESAISKIPSGYVVAPLYDGEKIRIEDLLYAIMLESANDAAYALAEHVGGTVENFSKMMNEKAKEIGCENTHFINPNGIHDEEHYTTVYDMYLISKYAMKNETFAKIVRTNQYTLSSTNKHPQKDRVMKNRNYFVDPNSKFYDKNVKGIKTGTTNQAGNCLITDAEKDGLEFMTIVFGSETYDSRFFETKKMIEYAFDNYTITDFYKKGGIIKNIEVKNATEETKNLNLIISDDISIMHNVEIDIEEIKPEILLNENITAPIDKGQEIGIVRFNVDGEEYSAKLLAENNVERKKYYVEILVGSGTLVLFLILIAMRRKNKKRKK